MCALDERRCVCCVVQKRFWSVSVAIQMCVSLAFQLRLKWRSFNFQKQVPTLFDFACHGHMSQRSGGLFANSLFSSNL